MVRPVASHFSFSGRDGGMVVQSLEVVKTLNRKALSERKIAEGLKVPPDGLAQR